MTLEEASGGEVDIWPDNILAVRVFLAMSTQWRMGLAGATGLDYGALPAVMRLSQVPPGERQNVFNDIRVLEDAALETLQKRGP